MLESTGWIVLSNAGRAGGGTAGAYLQEFLQPLVVKHVNLDAVRNRRPDVMGWPGGVPMFLKNTHKKQRCRT